MEAIEVKGADLLTESKKIIADKILNEYYPKIQRQLKNDVSLKVKIKGYSKEGKKKKYSINLEVIAPTKKFEASAFDWDFARTLHKVIDKVMTEIEHKFHSSDQHTKEKF